MIDDTGVCYSSPENMGDLINRLNDVDPLRNMTSESSEIDFSSDFFSLHMTYHHATPDSLRILFVSCDVQYHSCLYYCTDLFFAETRTIERPPRLHIRY